jgi:CubicO group peptidase (beta-lactamase class C family)
MVRHCTRVFVLITTFTLIVAFTAAQPSLETEQVDAAVEKLMTLYGIPGVSLAVVDEGELIYAQGYGVKSIETGEPMTTDTQSSIGSLTKSVTALAIAQQVDRGVLDLDAPITEYLPDFQLSDPAMTEKLTLRALLSNSAGFTPEDTVWYSGDLETMEEVVQYIQTLPVASEPGTTFAYNNLGYTLAGYVLQTVTGQPYEEYIQENIFAPLQMTEATLSFDGMQQTDNYVTPYLYDVRTGGAVAVPYFANLDAVAPAGAVNASVLEMANYAIMQLGDGTFNGERVVSAESLTEMHTQQVPGYALGWTLADYEGYATVWHNGSIDGFYALTVLIPSENLGVVALTNSDFMDYIGFLDAAVYQIIEMMLDIEPEQDIVTRLQELTGFDPAVRQERVEAAQNYQSDVETYAPYIGEYDSPLGDVTVALEDDQLVVRLTTQSLTQTFELFEFEPSAFIASGRGVSRSMFEFEVAEDENVTLSQDGNTIATKLGEGVEITTYTDPENRFTTTVPRGWTVEAQDGRGVMTSTEQAGTFVVGATESGDELQAGAEAIAEQIGSPVSGNPLATNPIPLPNGQEWTQYVWLTTGGEVLAVNVYTEDELTYFITVQAGQADIQALLNPLNELLLGFAIAE